MALDHSFDHFSAHPLAQAALAEVLGLHAFLKAWLGGTIADAPAMFARLESALADDFTQVTPGGARLSRADVIAALRGAHGTRAGAGAFRITIREPELLHLRPPLVVLGYVEEQGGAGAIVTRRRSTALFEALGESTPDAHAGLRWLALHETWIET